jgi:hypothetical protein
MTEQKTWIVEWFLQTNSIVTVQCRVKNQYKCKEYGEDGGGAVSRNWESDRQEKRRERATCSHTRHCWDHSCECGLISTEVCATVSRRKWGITFDSMAHTSNRSTHASVQDPCLPVSENCVRRKIDKVCRGIRWSLAAEHWRTMCSAVLPRLCLNWKRGSRKVVTGHKRNARLCCTELCITSSSGSRVPRGSHQVCHPQRYPYVKF